MVRPRVNFPKPCARCGVVYQPKYSWGIYCSRTCSNRGLGKERKCGSCGKMFMPGNKVTRYCNAKCRKSPNKEYLDVDRFSNAGLKKIYKEFPQLSPSVGRKKRVCLMCDREFTSRGPGNRRCNICEHKIKISDENYTDTYANEIRYKTRVNSNIY